MAFERFVIRGAGHVSNCTRETNQCARFLLRMLIDKVDA